MLRTSPPARAALLLALVLPLLLAACGDAPPAPAPGWPPAPPLKPSPDGRYYGQEVWITYTSEEHQALGRRIVARTREEAFQLAGRLRERVLAGADLGALAREHSNAPGACADGFGGVLPRNPSQPDERDLALMRASVGELTPLVDWKGGFWFARRIEPAAARVLEQRFLAYGAVEARGRLIHIHHRDAYPSRPKLNRTKEQAVELAESLLQRVLQGEDFAALAREYSEDDSGNEGGLLRIRAADGTLREWFRIDEEGLPTPVLAVLFDAPLGRVWPQVVVHGRGVSIVEPLERRPIPGRSPPPVPAPVAPGR